MFRLLAVMVISQNLAEDCPNQDRFWKLLASSEYCVLKVGSSPQFIPRIQVFVLFAVTFTRMFL